MIREHRQRMVLAAAVSALGVFGASASATQFLFEPFDYTAGDRLGGSGTSPLGKIAPNGEQWITRSPASGGTYNPNNDTLITAGNLGYSGLAPSSGASVRYGDATAPTGKYTDSIRLPGGMSINSGSIYYSAIVRFNQTTQIIAAGARHSYMTLSTDTANPLTDAGFGVGTASGTGGIPLPAGAWLRNSGTTDFHFGSGKQNSDGMGPSASVPSWQSIAAGHPFPNQQGNTGGTGQDWATAPADTWFVVLKYTFNPSGTSNDTVSMWVNPIASTLGDNTAESTAGSSGGSYYSAINANVTTANLDAAQIRSFMLLGLGQQSTSTTKSIDTSLDELRIGDSWADVTPKAPLTFDGDAAAGSNPSDTNGTWDAANTWWDGATNKSWGVNDSATFGTGSGSGSVTVTVASPQSAGKIIFAPNSPGYTVSGAAITLNGSDGSGVVANQSGAVTSDINVAANQTWTVTNGATFTAANVSGAGSIKKAGSGTVVANHVRTPGLNVLAGAVRVAPQANPYDVSSEAGTSKVTTLSASSGLIDLTNTKIITQDASFTAATYDPINDVYVYDGVHGLVQKGRGDGTWNGTNGITTSQTDATSGTLTSLAVGTGAELRGLGPTTTELFAGQTINGNSTIVMYTYGGDADMDGDLDGDDYFYLDSNVLASETVFGWHQGDFNYDGRLNGDDYFILDSNILQAQSSGNVFWVRPPEFSGGGVSAVPEPATLGLLGVAAMGLRRRRK